MKEKLEPSLKLSGQPVKRGTMAHEHIVYMMLVDAAARAGDEKNIRKFVPQLEELAQRDDHQPYIAVAHRAWGIAFRMAGEYQQAEERLQKALDIFENLGTPWQIGRTLYELGKLALDQADGAAAQNNFAQARALFEELGAKSDLDRIDAGLARIE